MRSRVNSALSGATPLESTPYGLLYSFHGGHHGPGISEATASDALRSSIKQYKGVLACPTPLPELLVLTLTRSGRVDDCSLFLSELKWRPPKAKQTQTTLLIFGQIQIMRWITPNPNSTTNGLNIVRAIYLDCVINSSELLSSICEAAYSSSYRVAHVSLNYGFC